LKSQDFNIGLSVTATSGYGPIELNTSNGEFAGGDGHPITLNGQVYPTGLGVHANSEIHIHATNLETPACTRFQADVGVDDEVGSNGSVVFQVFADGVKLFDSGVMTGTSATQHVDVGIGNKSDLRFVVTDAGNNSFYDHADWAGAALSCMNQSAPSATLDKSSLDIYHLHSNTLQATFTGYPAGPVQLRLVADSPQPKPEGYQNPPQAPDLVLNTTTVLLTGNQPQTFPVTISAPNSVRFSGGGQNSVGTFHLISSVNGADINSIPVTLNELRLNLTSHFKPSSISGPIRGTQSVILVTKIDPPLSGPVPITAGNNMLYNITVLSSGTTTGTGAEMRTPVQVRTEDYFGNQQSWANIVAVNISGVTSGYRDVWYGNRSTAILNAVTTPSP